MNNKSDKKHKRKQKQKQKQTKHKKKTTSRQSKNKNGGTPWSFKGFFSKKSQSSNFMTQSKVQLLEQRSNNTASSASQAPAPVNSRTLPQNASQAPAPVNSRTLPQNASQAPANSRNHQLNVSQTQPPPPPPPPPNAQPQGFKTIESQSRCSIM
jgi:hypothetical protein